MSNTDNGNEGNDDMFMELGDQGASMRQEQEQDERMVTTSSTRKQKNGVES